METHICNDPEFCWAHTIDERDNLRAENARLQERLRTTETELERDRESLWEAGREAERTVAQLEVVSLQERVEELEQTIKIQDNTLELLAEQKQGFVDAYNRYKVLVERRKEAPCSACKAIHFHHTYTAPKKAGEKSNNA